MGAKQDAQVPEASRSRPGQQQSGITRVVGALREQNTQLASMLSELQDAYGVARAQVQAELDVLRAERDALRELLQKEVEAAEAGNGEKSADLEAEVTRLRQLLEEKDAHISRLQAPPQASAQPAEADIEEYEAELNEFRRQVEADRQALNEEMEQLRIRNQELQDAAREAELELSRERAQLARERVQLDRLRDEIRRELELAQRNAEADQLLAPVQRLQEEITGRHRPADSPGEGNGQREGNLLARWRSIRNRLTDPEAR
jgi:chromosome segregation ATPase